MRTVRVDVSARSSVLFLAVYLTAACTTWQPQVGAPGSVVSERRPDRVRLSVANGAQVIVEGPSVRTDSIVGEAASGGSSAVALTDVSQVEVRERDTTATVLAVVVVGVLVWAASQACFGLVSPCGDGS